LASHGVPPTPRCAMAETQYRLLQVNSEGDVLVLTITEAQVEGDTIAQALHKELLAARQAADARNVVVDFQNVLYISSVAFGPLLGIRRTLQGLDGRLIVCGLNQMVGDIFYTTRMVSPTGEFSAPFEMKPDVPSAIAAMASPPKTEPPPA